MNSLRRLKFYGIGFGLGLAIIYAMFGTRSCTSVNEMKMQELVFQHFQLSEKAQCKLKCIENHWIEKNYNKQMSFDKILPDSINALHLRLLKIQLRHFEVNYDVSSPRKEPCGEYFVKPQKEFISAYDFELLMQDCDTITKINDINITSTFHCNCQ